MRKTIKYNNRLLHFSEDNDLKGKSFGGVMEKESSFNTLDGTINTILREFPNHKVNNMSGGYISLKNFKKELKEARKNETNIRTN